MRHKENLIIIGAGGHAKVCLDIAVKMNQWKQISILDDYSIESNLLGYPIIGIVDDAEEYKKNSDFFVAIGDNSTRSKLMKKLEVEELSIATLVHPNSYIGLAVEVGTGSAIMANVVINSNTVIGEGCIINTAAVIEHDNTIHNYVHISPNASLAGDVTIHDNTWIGISATVLNQISISKSVIIGAGTVVTKNIHKSGTYVGVPARSLEY